MPARAATIPAIFGGLLANPGIELAHALACITGPKGEIRIPEWTPGMIPDSVKRVLARDRGEGRSGRAGARSVVG